jgi:hypothetical protein
MEAAVIAGQLTHRQREAVDDDRSPIARDLLLEMKAKGQQ